MGRKTEALGKLELLEGRYRKGTASAYDLALLYAGLNDRDQALEWLEKAFTDRSGGLLQLKADIMFDPIRSDARFESLVRRLGLPPT